MHKTRASALLPLLLLLTAASPPELQRWRDTAARVTITRDDWGIAHIRGRSDADAVFGMIYAQAEDDFPRIEANYLTALGRMAEAEGESAVWQDLRARLYASEAELRAHYAKSPEPMRRLMDAWADGLNFFLATHPEVKPRVLTRFEPWMALSFTEGSIGGDIERIDLEALQEFYSVHRHAELGSASISATSERAEKWTLKQVQGGERHRLERQASNGIAIAPGLTRDGKPLLLINPHTSFYFRSEQQVTSGEGLNVYGAATWGQFFVYQGFNDALGWMHTSSGVDSVDEFAVEVSLPELGPRYRYGTGWRVMTERPVTIRYRLADGRLGERRFTTYATHHGPIVRRGDNGRWVAFAMMHRPVEALQQSFLRTKARDFAGFLRVAELRSNSSNNTIFASSKGEIAYLHPQFVPRRDDRFDYTRPVDGSDPATDWRGLHTLSELPSAINPAVGWVQNTNSWPYRAAGGAGLAASAFPRYMDMDGPNYREIHALKLLDGSRGWTLERLNQAAYDSFQPGFAVLVPALVGAWQALPRTDPRRRALAEPIAVLRRWDFRWSERSIAQSLAMFWGDALRKAQNAPASEPRNKAMMRLARDTSPEQKLHALEVAVERLRSDFGRWRVPWGEINRFQRLSGAVSPPYSDRAPSLPIPFADGHYGSLASVRSGPKPGTRRWYADYGNSFVAVVEFGPRVRAKALSAGGQSGNPASPHFTDQARLYPSGALREVYFYPDELQRHAKRVYRPGE